VRDSPDGGNNAARLAIMTRSKGNLPDVRDSPNGGNNAAGSLIVGHHIKPHMPVQL